MCHILPSIQMPGKVWTVTTLTGLLPDCPTMGHCSGPCQQQVPTCDARTRSLKQEGWWAAPGVSTVPGHLVFSSLCPQTEEGHTSLNLFWILLHQAFSHLGR